MIAETEDLIYAIPRATSDPSPIGKSQFGNEFLSSLRAEYILKLLADQKQELHLIRSEICHQPITIPTFSEKNISDYTKLNEKLIHQIFRLQLNIIKSLTFNFTIMATLIILNLATVLFLHAYASFPTNHNFNKEFGSIFSLVGPAHFNQKPVIAIRYIDFSQILKSCNFIDQERQALFTRLINDSDIDFYTNWENRMTDWDKILDKDIEFNIALIKASDYSFNKSRDRLEEFLQEQRALYSIKIKLDQSSVSHSPSITDHTQNRTKRAFPLVPLIFSVLPPLAKLIGGTLGSRLIGQVTSALQTGTLLKAVTHLTSKHIQNYVTAKDHVLPSPHLPIEDFSTKKSTLAQNDLDFTQLYPRKEHKKISEFRAAYHIDTNSDANIFAYSHVNKRMDFDVAYFKQNRQIVTDSNNDFLHTLQDIKNGKITTASIPLDVMSSIIQEINNLIKEQFLKIDFPVPTSDVINLYQFVTPYAIIQDHSMLLFLIFPMIQKGESLKIFHIQSIPFMSKDHIPLELTINEEFYATDQTGNKHTMLSREEFNQCTPIKEALMCNIARPMTTVRSLCYNAIYFGYSIENDIIPFCTFSIADATKPRFAYISPNNFAYFITRPAKLHESCTGVDEAGKETSNATHKILPQSGSFSYPPRCQVTLENYHFPDTTVELVNQSYLTQEQVLSILQVIPGPWSKLTNLTLNDVSELRQAIQDTSATEPAYSISNRAKVYKAFGEIGSIGKEQTIQLSFFSEIRSVITGVAITTLTSAISLIWLFCRRQLPEKRVLQFPKCCQACLFHRQNAQLSDEIVPVSQQHQQRLHNANINDFIQDQELLNMQCHPYISSNRN